MIFLFIRHNTAEFIVGLSFALSCLFHLVAVMAENNGIYGWLDSRPLFNTYNSVFQIATVLFLLTIGGGFNGGRRIGHNLRYHHSQRNRLLCSTAYKDRT
jgi:hypothetical protein